MGKWTQGTEKPRIREDNLTFKELDVVQALGINTRNLGSNKLSLHKSSVTQCRSRRKEKLRGKSPDARSRVQKAKETGQAEWAVKNQPFLWEENQTAEQKDSRWGKGASAVFRVKEGCPKSRNLKRQKEARLQGKPLGESFSSSLNPQEHKFGKHSRDTFNLEILGGNLHLGKRVKQGENLPQCQESKPPRPSRRRGWGRAHSGGRATEAWGSAGLEKCREKSRWFVSEEPAIINVGS